jgi:hypothetical protein
MSQENVEIVREGYATFSRAREEAIKPAMEASRTRTGDLLGVMRGVYPMGAPWLGWRWLTFAP